MCCLEGIAIANNSPTEWNAETRSNTQLLFLTVFIFSFAIALVLTQKLLLYIKAFSVKFQGHYVHCSCLL